MKRTHQQTVTGTCTRVLVLGAMILALARANNTARGAAQDWANEIKRKPDTRLAANTEAKAGEEAASAQSSESKPAPAEEIAPVKQADTITVTKTKVKAAKPVEGDFTPTDTSTSSRVDSPEVVKAREALRAEQAKMNAHVTPLPPVTLAPVAAPVVLARADTSAPPAEAAAPAPVTTAPVAAPAPVVAPAITPAAPVISSSTNASDKRLYAFQASDLDLKAALAAFARANNLNIVPDNDVMGSVTLDVRDLPLDQMMRALLEASDCTWQEEHGLIRVRNYATRTFTVDYLRLSRKGVGQSSAMLASGTSGGTSGGLGGSVGGGMAGGGGGGMTGGMGGAPSTGGSAVNLTADNPIDFWKELKEEMGFMLTEKGKSTMAVNMTAGLVQVTDRPSALKRVEDYLSVIDRSVHRQVEIEAKIYDVTLNDQFEFGIDWAHVARAYGGVMGFGSSTLPMAIGGGQLADSTLGGINTLPTVGSTAPGGNVTTLVFRNLNTSAAITALQQQGRVEVISKPRIRTLNNQTALIKVGEEVPFFNTSTTLVPGTSAGTSTVLQDNLITSITVGTILSITPQISDDQFVSLDISPVLTTLKGIVFSGGTNSNSGGSSGGGSASAPNLDTKQASTMVRVHDGTTVIIGGLIQTENSKSKRKVPVLGDVPLLGNLFTGTFDFKQKKELVMFVTPHIIHEGEASVTSVPTIPKL